MSKVKKIFCIMGYTSTGKDTISKEVIKMFNGKLKFLVSHTTRPMRKNEKEGREYYFIDNREFFRMKEYNGFVETRTYHTKVEKNGEIIDDTWYYGLAASEVESCEYGLFIVDADGFNEIKARYGKHIVIPIYISVNEEKLRERAIKRGDLKEEFERRLADDKVKFKDFRVRTVYKSVFNNGDVQNAINEVATYIRGEMGGRIECQPKKK